MAAIGTIPSCRISEAVRFDPDDVAVWLQMAAALCEGRGFGLNFVVYCQFSEHFFLLWNKIIGVGAGGLRWLPSLKA